HAPLSRSQKPNEERSRKIMKHAPFTSGDLSLRRGFTLIELITVIAIIGMLAVLVAPEYGKIKARAPNLTCVNNLRQIGVGVLAYAGQNDNTYPMIEPDANDPVYKPDENGEVEAKPPLPDVLEPYGVTSQVLKCPTDAHDGADSYFTKLGTSYQ